MMADELDGYKGRGNFYVDENIQEIQELYINEGQQKKEKGRIKEEVILIKLYEVSSSTSSSNSSFANKEVDNLLKYMKFINFPI